MDFMSAILAIFEKGSAHIGRMNELKREASRLNAEAGSEVGRCQDILALAFIRIKNKCQMVAPDNPEIWETIEQGLTQVRRDVDAAADMYEKTQKSIDEADGHKMPAVMSKITTMHATSKRLVPWTQGVVDHYDQMLDNAHKL